MFVHISVNKWTKVSDWLVGPDPERAAKNRREDHSNHQVAMIFEFRYMRPMPFKTSNLWLRTPKGATPVKLDFCK